MYRVAMASLLLFSVPAVLPAKVNVLDHGAKADGRTDDTAAIQKALDTAGKDRGGVVEMPKGLYQIDGHLVIPPGVCLSGQWQAPHHANTEHGTVILATGYAGKEDGPALINLQQNSSIKGVTIFYPDQDPVAVKPYPWAIQGRGMHGSVIDVTLVNPYKEIDFGTHPNELHYIRNVFGCPLKLGIYVNGTTDIGRIENVHFNPHAWGRCTFNDKAKGDGWKALCTYLEQNLVGFQIGKTDWEYMSGCFVIFAKVGLHFVKTENGEPNVVLTQCGSDIGHGSLHCTGNNVVVLASITEDALIVLMISHHLGVEEDASHARNGLGVHVQNGFRAEHLALLLVHALRVGHAVALDVEPPPD